MIISLDYKPITLQPLEVRPVSVTGSVFSCLSSTGQFFASFDGGPFIPLQGGIAIDNRPNLFTSIVLQNKSQAALSLTFYCGTCAVTYSPVTVQVVSTNAPTVPKGYDPTVLGGGASIKFDGAGNTRKQFILTNLDAAAALYIRDGAAGKTLLPVLAGESKTIEVSGAVWVYNPNGGDISYCVGEIFYA